MRIPVFIDQNIGAEIFPSLPTSRRHSGASRAIIPHGGVPTVVRGEPIRYSFLSSTQTFGQKCVGRYSALDTTLSRRVAGLSAASSA